MGGHIEGEHVVSEGTAIEKDGDGANDERELRSFHACFPTAQLLGLHSNNLRCRVRLGDVVVDDEVYQYLGLHWNEMGICKVDDKTTISVVGNDVVFKIQHASREAVVDHAGDLLDISYGYCSSSLRDNLYRNPFKAVNMDRVEPLGNDEDEQERFNRRLEEMSTNLAEYLKAHIEGFEFSKILDEKIVEWSLGKIWQCTANVTFISAKDLVDKFHFGVEKVNVIKADGCPRATFDDEVVERFGGLSLRQMWSLLNRSIFQHNLRLQIKDKLNEWLKSNDEISVSTSVERKWSLIFGTRKVELGVRVGNVEIGKDGLRLEFFLFEKAEKDKLIGDDKKYLKIGD